MFRSLITRGFRSAVAWSMALACLRVGGAILVLPLIVHILSPDELGLWYVFLSIGSFTALLDLGFGPTMTRAAGYAWGGARELKAIGLHMQDSPEALSTSAPNYLLLARLVATMRLYYRALSFIVLFCMLTGGTWWIVHKTGNFHNHTTLLGAWIFFALGTFINNNSTMWPALLSGINGVRQSQQLWVVSVLTNYFVVASTLLSGFGIWSMVLGQFIGGIVLRQGGKIHFFRLAGPEFREQQASVDWQMIHTLWPMSWRSAVVSLGTFLILNANTLICSAYLGLAETASYGLTLQVIGFLNTLSTAWVQVKFPLINQLRARYQLRKVVDLFIERMRLMMVSYIVGALLIAWMGNEVLGWIHAKTHLIPLPILVTLLVIYFLEMHHGQFATLIITENVMPFIWGSILSGIGVMILSLLLTPHYGLWGIVISFGCVQLLFNNWWPVLRGIRGLQIEYSDYWRLFWGLSTHGRNI